MSIKRYVCLLIMIILVFVSAGCKTTVEEEFIGQYVSPNGKYTVDIYVTQPDATVDFSIKAYLAYENNKKECFYNAYHESSAEVSWINDDVIVINGKQLNLSKGETFDWRVNGNKTQHR